MGRIKNRRPRNPGERKALHHIKRGEWQKAWACLAGYTDAKREHFLMEVAGLRPADALQVLTSQGA